MSLRIMIVEDEPLARDRLRGFLEGEEDLEIVGECCDGESAVAAVAELRPDLLLLDVQMPELDGFAVLDRVPEEERPAVVFITAYDEFAVRAFETHAVDYILKPFEEERFRHALERGRSAVAQRRAGNLDDRLRSLLGDAGRRRWLDRIAVKEGGRILLLRVEEITWIGAEGNYVRLNTARGDHLLRETMTGLEDKLDPERFLRIHRSTIVNVDHVAALEPLYQGDYVVILRDGTRVTSSRGYRPRMQAWLDASA